MGQAESGLNPAARSVLRQLLGPLVAAVAFAGLVVGPWAAAEQPVRWSRGAAVWSTSQQELDTFLSTGVVRDRGLEAGLHGAGWSPEQIRAAMNKLYSVDLAAVARFLDSPAGEALLRGRADTYFPYWSQGRTGVQALRAAILIDSADGRISSASIVAALPADMRLTQAPAQPLLTWLVFLPARIQGGSSQRPAPAGAPGAAAGTAPAAR